MGCITDIDVVVKFDKSDIRQLCNAIHFGDEKLGKKLYEKLDNDEELFNQFRKELQETSFNSKLVDAADESCANDWLSEFNIAESE